VRSKIILSLFISVLLIGIAFAAGETTTTGTTATTDTSTTNTIFKLGILNKIGTLFGLKSEDLTVQGVELTNGEDENTLKFLEGGSVNILGDSFKNVEKNSLIKLDDSGEIKSADLTANADTSFNFKGFGDAIKVSKGNRLVYENGEINIYKSTGKETISVRQNVFDKDGNNIAKFMDIKMNGDSFNIKKLEDGNILTGNINIGADNIRGVGENGVGKVTLSKEGKISEIWKGTDATVKNANFKVSGDNLKMYYDADFKPSDHLGENYFSYKKDTAYFGGNEFTVNFADKNAMFGDMYLTKQVNGIGTKKRGFEATLNGGNLELSKYSINQNDFGFNVQSEGKFTINNGRNLISSDGNGLFVEPNKDDEGLLYSYDLNFNNGEYKLESNIFTNRDGSLRVNNNKPWENAILIAKDTSSSEAKALRLEVEKEGRLIFVDEPNFLQWLNNITLSPCGESIMKQVYTATETANENKYGATISPLQVYGVLKAEGAGYKPKGSLRIPFFDTYCKNPNKEIIGTEVGLTLVGSANYIAKVKEGDFVSEDLQVRDYPAYKELTGQTPPRLKAKDAFEYLAGVMAYKESLFNKDFKELYGEEEYNKLTPDEKSYWLTFFYWGENTARNALKDRTKNYVKVWEGAAPTDQEDYLARGKYLSRHRTDFEYYLQKLGLFDYP
jgi:hypothetical protein